jgi:aminomuconate-semialdehyde/2-hydroxymuconate-6-semialdehyde dehydrogenase
VFEDCDFDKTVTQAVRSAFTNAGQVCLAGSRLLIQRTIYDKFLAAFVAATEKLVVGDPATSNIGSLTSLQHRDKVESYVELARADGARILCGGRRPDLPAPFNEGAFYMPTVIDGLPSTHKCSVEEIFGCVVTAHPFDTEKEAIDMANGTPYGLAGSVWTRDGQRASRVARSWNTGMVWVNCWLHRDLRVPFGGVKESGVGFEGGHHSLESYSNFKNICFHHG